jgi:hypothetical protein
VSWQQLLDIAELNRQLRQEELSRPPFACPNDGTPLQPAPASAEASLFCPHDGWQYPRDDDRPTE